MTSLFPDETSTTSPDFGKVKAKKFLDEPSDKNYISPVDKTKG